MLDSFDVSRSEPSHPIRRVCVYCGASPGTDPLYAAAARDLGAALAEAGIELVYGGGTDGLMGVVAQSVLANGGRVTGIIPTFLTHQCRTTLRGDHELVVVEHMHARKQAMFDMADGLIALPGGLGTLEELVEQMTWLKLGRHHKPLLLADIGGFWNPLLELIDHMSTCGFLGAQWLAPFQVCRSVDAILAALRPRSGAAVAYGHARFPTIEPPLIIEDAARAAAARNQSHHETYAV